MAPGKDVDRYLERAPKEAQSKLRQIRAVIREAVPEAIEGISYGMPHYSFPGETGFQSRLCYFGIVKSKRAVVFYTRPGFLEEVLVKAEPYMKTKSALHFPLDRPIPFRLIKKIVTTGRKKHAPPQR